MKVLWVSLVEFPPLAKHLGNEVPKGCGWLYSSAKALIDNLPDCQLGVLVYSYGKQYQKYDIDGISYYLIPSCNMGKSSKKQVDACKQAICDFVPKLIHIHGTEHSLAQAVCMANEGGIRTIVNIQGLASGIVQYADGGYISLCNITSRAEHDEVAKIVKRKKNKFK